MKFGDERPDVREIIGKAIVSGNLAEDQSLQHRIMDVHRVAALASAPLTGSAAWRLKFAHDPKSYKTTVALLARRAAKFLKLPLAKRGEPNRILFRASAQAVREFMYTACLRCGGSGRRTINGALVVSCDKCGGDGARGWTDAQRASALGLDREVFLKVWSGRLAKISRLLAEADTGTEAAVRRQLGLRSRRAA